MRLAFPIGLIAALTFTPVNFTHAALTAFWTQNTITPAAIANDPVLASMQSWSLRVSYTDGDWSSACMRAALPGAPNVTYYKHPLGSFSKPDPANLINFPSLEFTTYVASVADNGTNNVTLNLGGFPGIDGPSLGDPTSIAPGNFNFSWGDLVLTLGPQSRLEIARLTFPTTMNPSVVQIAHFGSRTGQINPPGEASIPNIPEPAALGFALAALIAFRRKRAA